MTSPSEEEIENEKFHKQMILMPEWGADAKSANHLWCRSSASGDLCYVSNDVCMDRGFRIKCSSCKVIVHDECRNILTEKMKILCRPTFQDADLGSYRENTDTNHHWIAKPTQKGRCRSCSKTFGGKVANLLNDTIAMTCSWCKEMCHTKDFCFNSKKMAIESCTLGIHANLMVPPTWIVKLPCKESEDNLRQVFAIKPIPSTTSKPLLVFINPKSGGNQGTKLLRTFQWLLNPRQVFDLTEGGPRFGLELYKRVPNMRILACGGDGTVGWILSVLDVLKMCPAIAVLPLGTGNDLARSLGWGGGYTDEPLTKILTNVEEGEIIELDRWILKVTPNEAASGGGEEGRSSLPLTVVNNYFSLGVDARIALEFHEAREAKPGKFNSRFRNKMFYGQAGGKDLIQRKWKDLCNYVSLECDGQDMTQKLREMKVHSILFLNISHYGGGTKPWGPTGQFQNPKTDDGLIEVIGLTTYQLPLLQAGGHGTPIAQCRKARLITSCTIPVQVDGEPCRLLPSIIELKLLNTVHMIAKTKRHGASMKSETIEKIDLPVKLIEMQIYEDEHHRKESLEPKASVLGNVIINFHTDLAEIRSQINQLLLQKDQINESEENDPHAGKKTTEWWFLDSCSGEKFYRIDAAQEQLYYVNDVCNQQLYITEQITELQDDVAKSERDDVRSISSGSPQSHRNDNFKNISENPDENVKNSANIKEEMMDISEMDLLMAAKMGNLDQVARLHSAGHSLMQKDHEGRTALHHAAFIGNADVVRYIVAYAPISVLDAQDDIMFQTALHRAVTRIDRIICSLLVSAGASLDIKDKQGYTAEQLAEIMGDHVLAEYLKSVENPVLL